MVERTGLEKIQAIKQQMQAHRWEGKTLAQIRQVQPFTIPIPPGTTIEKTTIANLPAEWIRADHVPAETKSTVLYFHGGGFVVGSCDTHRDLAIRISRAGKTRVLLLEYRLAPEHKFPAANEDCLAAYRWLIQNGVSPREIILGGDSAGGSLVLMTLLSLRDSGEPLPAAAFMMSPVGDWNHFDGETYQTRAHLDPMVSAESNRMCREWYLDDPTAEPAILSPIRQNLAGLPPLFIQVGDHEVLLNDATRLAERAKEAGVDATLEIWENMWHIFPWFGQIIVEADQAVERIGKFIQTHLNVK